MTGVVTNVFEAVDVITLIKGGMYDELNLNVGEALQNRSEVLGFLLPIVREILTSRAGFPRDLYVLDR